MLHAVTALAMVAALAVPPAEFGTDWDDPRTADPPVSAPHTRSCTVTVVDHGFAGWDPYRSSYTPPAGCAGPWAKVVLRLDGAVAGRQYDRLGSLSIGDTTVFKTSTPEPSPQGIRWQVEKDVSGYASLLRRPQPVTMLLGNTVDDTYTGVLDIRVTLTFYVADRRHRPARAADDVLAPTRPIPRNTERLVAEVYATGSGGGCEEFWYLTAPGGYSCPADSPYREVQILVDGRVAGIAAPYPHIYTGGWSNPFLWYVLPAPRAFDVKPIGYDLTPYVGLLTDGVAHRIDVRVVGVPAGQPGWDTPVNLLAWRDHGSRQVTGGLLVHHVTDLVDRVEATPGRVVVHGGHSLAAVGYLRTSHGYVTSAVHRTVGNDSTHTWGAGENPDALTATWTDDGRRYTIDGAISVAPDNRLTTTLSLSDSGPGYRHTWTGEAGYFLGVPREQRHATGWSEERYNRRILRTENGYLSKIATTSG